MKNMPAGKSTDHTLAHRLDALVPPAGSAFDKAGAWEKLQPRLAESKKKFTGTSLWSRAAAVLLPAFCIYLLIPAGRPRGENISRSIPPEQVIPLQQPAALPAAEAVAPVVNTSTPVLTPVSVHTRDTLQSEAKVTIAEPVKKELSVDTAIATTMQPVPVMVKKKLPVVYNNEIVRTEVTETPPGSSGTGISIPGLKNENRETIHKAESNDTRPDGLKNSWLPFNKSAKPKE